jgi:polyisoprenoid-binding protein YceI
MKHRATVVSLLILAPALALAACAPNPADNVPAAQVDTGTESAGAVTGATFESPTVEPAIAIATETMTGTLPVGTYPLTGTLQFQASKVTRTHVVEFKSWNGTYTSDGTLPGTALGFTVDLSSLVVDENNRDMLTPKLEDHLKSADFFDVAVNPTATFTSTSIVEGVDPVQFPSATGATHTVTGTLDINGVVKEVTFPITVTVSESGNSSAVAEFSINRQDFGLVYPGAPDDLIRDEVVLSIDATMAPAE